MNTHFICICNAIDCQVIEKKYFFKISHYSSHLGRHLEHRGFPKGNITFAWILCLCLIGTPHRIITNKQNAHYQFPIGPKVSIYG